ncbi:alpha/beta-hydrolase [Periconia macrospinosa]|uniref:Alpha/beta-hydrolase n=1 Tax=Periconia macrospinosa TaxID=97972 RepID=A0A2V1DUN2_9PLEO|nr:alpha/beta-hydrolase [Periconia macrospinosa]
MFTVREHVISCQNIRGYAHGTKSNTIPLKLAVKEYIPTNEATPTDGTTPVTIIAAHANGISKEAYEPMFEELGKFLKGKLKAIWFADCAHQGASGILNEGLLGDDPNWFDHSRDLLALVNEFRDRIQPPIIGVAHSMGCAQLVQLSIIHPRLFQSLILIDPVIRGKIPPGPNAAMMTTMRPDLWNSLEEAKADFRRNKFYKSWDPRALDKYLEYGLRSTPTFVYPNAPTGSVTLATTKHQEAWSYVRSVFPQCPPEDQLDDQERFIAGDMPVELAQYQFHRAEALVALEALSSLQPSITWIFGGKSYINSRADREDLLKRTGSASRGSGGVQSIIVEGAGHMLPLEKVSQTANLVGAQIEAGLDKYKKEVEFWKTYDSGKSDETKAVVSEKWKKAVRQKPDTKRQLATTTASKL